MPDDLDLTIRLDSLREVLSTQIDAVEKLCVGRMDGQDSARAQYLQTLSDDRGWLDLRIQSARERSEALNEAMQRQVDQRMADMRGVLDERYAGQAKAIEAALAGADKAVARAEAAADKRFDSVNEFRKTLTDQTATFLPRPEFDAAYRALTERIGGAAERVAALELRLTSRLDRGEGADVGAASQRTDYRLNLSQVIAFLAVVATVASLIVLVTKK